jgi:hypothetical protein
MKLAALHSKSNQVGILTVFEDQSHFVPLPYDLANAKFVYPPDSRNESERIFEVPQHITASLHAKDSGLYLGTNFGNMVHFPKTIISKENPSGFSNPIVTSRLNVFTDEQKIWDRFHGKEGYEVWQDQKLRAKEQLEGSHAATLGAELRTIFENRRDAQVPPEYDGFYFNLHERYQTNFWKIESILREHTGRILDSSLAGVFDSKDNRRIMPNQVRSSQLIYGNYVAVIGPYSIDERLMQSHHERSSTMYDIGVDLKYIGGSIALKDASPLDGSGYSPGKIVVADKVAYRLHGNWPCETLDSTCLFQQREIAKVVGGHFSNAQIIAHDGKTYFLGDGDKQGVCALSSQLEMTPITGIPNATSARAIATSKGLVVYPLSDADSTLYLCADAKRMNHTNTDEKYVPLCEIKD